MVAPICHIDVILAVRRYAVGIKCAILAAPLTHTFHFIILLSELEDALVSCIRHINEAFAVHCYAAGPVKISVATVRFRGIPFYDKLSVFG